MLRSSLALTAFAASLAPALAGGCSGASCYRQEYVPPTYRTVAERVMVRAPRTYAHVIPAQYGIVNETVQVSGGGKYWTYQRDAYGRLVKCLVAAPPRYAQVSRRVMVRGPEVVPQIVPAQYAIRHHTVMAQPGYKTWVPMGGYRSSHGGGYGYGGGGYGGGYGAASYGGGYGAASYGGGYGYSSYGGSYGGGLVGAGLGVAGAGLGLAGAGLNAVGGGLGYGFD